MKQPEEKGTYETPYKSREVGLTENLVASVFILIARLKMFPCLAF